MFVGNFTSVTNPIHYVTYWSILICSSRWNTMPLVWKFYCATSPEPPSPAVLWTGCFSTALCCCDSGTVSSAFCMNWNYPLKFLLSFHSTVEMILQLEILGINLQVEQRYYDHRDAQDEYSSRPTKKVEIT